MNPQELQRRTFDFSVRAYKFARPLLRNVETRRIGDQLIRASTSIAANYRAACHARSRREFCSKIGTVREEADESLFWLEFIRAAGLASGQVLNELLAEAKELSAIFAASYRTARRRLNAERRERRQQRLEAARAKGS
ncbi:MAG TPA: four helix bundle protein [Vicinamibacterales bacterium]|nr:four helix bundle protein [Vicinamibacterales bacterium]